jgi:cyclic-di-GMP-binding protein
VAKDESFDIVSEVNLQEVDNAINQANKEITTRFDFKGSKSDIKFDGKVITLISDDEFKLKSVVDVLQSKLFKRDISLKSLKFGKLEPASAGTVRQVVELQQGISQDVSRVITKLVKDSKIKVQASIQGDQVRISGKNRDDLQAVIQLLKAADIEVPLQFTNYR